MDISGITFLRERHQ